MRSMYFLPLVLLFVQGCTSNAPVHLPKGFTYATHNKLSDETAVDIYETALRHFIKVYHHPVGKPCYVYLDGNPAPDVFIQRFKNELVIKTGGEELPKGAIFYGLQLGTVAGNDAYVLLAGAKNIPEKHMKILRLKKSWGHWVVISDEAFTIS